MSKLALLLSMLMFIACGEAHATLLAYHADLDGPSESPPNASPGIGQATITYDTDLLTLRVEAAFSDLLGTTTASHIHCCTASPLSGTVGVATMLPSFDGFPLGVTSGNYDHTFDLTLAASFNGSFITANGGTVDGARAALLAGLAGGQAYFNIHTNQFPGGEIRGFLVVPEPAAWSLLGFGVLLAARPKRRLP